SCPGSVLYGMVKSGVLIASGVPKPTEPKQEEDMPDYVSIGVGEAQDLPPGKWVTVRWDKEYSDAAHHHRNARGTSTLMGHARYPLDRDIAGEGVPRVPVDPHGARAVLPHLQCPDRGPHAGCGAAGPRVRD